MRREGVGSPAGKHEVCGHWNPGFGQLGIPWQVLMMSSGSGTWQSQPAVSHFPHFHVWCLKVTEPCGNCREKEALGVLGRSCLGYGHFWRLWIRFGHEDEHAERVRVVEKCILTFGNQFFEKHSSVLQIQGCWRGSFFCFGAALFSRESASWSPDAAVGAFLGFPHLTPHMSQPSRSRAASRTG